MPRGLFKFCGGPLDGEQRLMDVDRNGEINVKAVDWTRHVYRFDLANWGLSYVGKAPVEVVERRMGRRDRRIGEPDRRSVRVERRIAQQDRRAA